MTAQLVDDAVARVIAAHDELRRSVRISERPRRCQGANGQASACRKIGPVSA
jgi:hypothetical protein